MRTRHDDNGNENDKDNEIMSNWMGKYIENKSDNKELACNMKQSFRHMWFVLVTNEIN